MRTIRSLALAFVLGGCAHQTLRPADIRPVQYNNGPAISGRVEGLRAALGRLPDQPVRIVTIHGMIRSSDDYSRKFQKAVGERLKLKRSEQEEALPIERGYDSIIGFGPQPFANASIQFPQSRLRRTAWLDKEEHERLVFYELFWAPFRDEMKYEFLGCFESRSVGDQREDADDGADWSCAGGASSDGRTIAGPNPDARALINGALKDGVMVAGFADALVVLGPLGDVLEDDLALAFCIVANEALGSGAQETVESYRGRRCEADKAQLAAADSAWFEKPQFFIVTESLGSFYLMNAAIESAMSQQDSAENLAQLKIMERATVYMFANQVALLNLASLRPYCEPDDETATSCPNSKLATETPWDSGVLPWPGFTTYVAFNDVDDLLGFELPPYLAETGLANRLVNISVRNRAFGFPGLIFDPSQTHLNHKTNKAVIEAIVEGFDIPAAD